MIDTAAPLDRFATTEEMFIAELGRAVAFVEYSLTTSINFEGTAESLVVDEIQFLLNAGCVIFDTPSHSVSNILDDERQVICDYIDTHTMSREQQTVPGAVVTRQQFPALGDDNPAPAPLRRALHDVSAAYIVTANRSADPPLVLRIYYDPRNAPFPFWETNQFAHQVVRMLAIAAPLIRASLPAPPATNQRLYTQFLESIYLENVLTALQNRITEHLVRANSHFRSFAQNPFFLQFFLPTEPAASAPHRHWLRFFPLKKQRTLLQDAQQTREINELLRNRDLSLPMESNLLQFLTRDYLWDASRSFVGYVYQTGTALYLQNWESEPRVIGSHLPSDEQRQRSIATTLMQRLRGDTPHLFLLPLLSKQRPIAVAIINCPVDVAVPTRIAPIRSARGLGYMLSLALETDDLVNHVQAERRKATAVRSYKHATQSILHGEGSYCMELQAFLRALKRVGATNNPELAGYIERISYIVRDKQDLIDEFRTAQDPIREIHPRRIYPTLDKIPKGQASISVDYINKTIPMLASLVMYGGSPVAVDPVIGGKLGERGAVEDLSHFIVDRIIVNLLKNAVRAGRERGVSNPRIVVTLDIVNRFVKEALSIIAEDNCGGFHEGILKMTDGEITFDSWSRCLETTKSPRGMGFFMLAKYARAANGQCRIGNVIVEGQPGARVELLLALNRESSR